MGIRIHQLPPVIANQIAAGEVIERPASVVKELLENSLDAGADSITVEISYGGLNQIKICDNGQGIIAEDLPLALMAHATSKITTLDDLYAIASMGFRGEALASIASVAKVTLSSKPESQEHAMSLHAENGNLRFSLCARSLGTTVDVEDLFFNAPVRKRFLKNEKLEFQAIEGVIKRFALSAPHIQLTLKHNNKLILTLPSATQEHSKQERMSKILGSSFMKEALYLDVEHASMHLRGWISGINYQRSQNDRQWVYINQRMVKDKLLHHAIKQAYDNLLHPGRFPACLLYFSMNHSEVDVNVHPTKHEVRFQHPRVVHDFFTSQLGAVLQKNKAIEYEQGFPDETSSKAIPFFYTQLQDTESQGNDVDNRVKESPAVYLKTEFSMSRSTTLGSSDLVGFLNPVDTLHALEKVKPLEESEKKCKEIDDAPWISINRKYSLVIINHQSYLVDVLALQQYWLFEQLKESDFPLRSRPLLVPVTLSLKMQAEALQPYLEPLGIRIEPADKSGDVENYFCLVRTIPIQIPHLDLSLFLNTITDLTTLNQNVLLELMSQSQKFKPQLLSKDERMALSHFLWSHPSPAPGIFKVLGEEDCRMLLHNE